MPAPKLDSKMKMRILHILKQGNYRSVAARAVGIDPVTFADWMNRGQQGEEPYYSFYADVIRAESEAEQEMIRCITKAGRHTWQAAAWYLERKHPERYGRLDRLAEAPHKGKLNEFVEAMEKMRNGKEKKSDKPLKPAKKVIKKKKKKR